MNILVCNAGSTSLKFKLYLFPEKKELFKGKVERIGDVKGIFSYENLLTGFKFYDDKGRVESYEEGITLFLNCLINKEKVINDISQIDVVGFKTVLSKDHIGVHIIDENVIKGMEEYMDVAPVHNGSYLKAIRLFQKITPNAKLVGVFETAFHQNITKEKYIYSVPYEWYEKYGVRKFGYHGASHGYTAKKIEEEFGKGRKIISLHLGGSSSACAIKNGESIDTSFGLSLQTGVLNANRNGDIDSFIIPYMVSNGLSLEEVTKELIENGGLKGISGISGDMRDLNDAIQEGNERAKLAVDIFVYSILKYIGLFAIELEGFDILSFTAGIGESQWKIRKMICDKLDLFGVKLDEEKNLNPDKYNGTISSNDSKVIVKVVKADEEIIVAEKAYNEVIC